MMVGRDHSQHEQGSVAVLTMLSMAMLLTLAALALSGASAYAKRNVLSAAADAAAKLGATEIRRNSSLTATNLTNFANQQVTLHGLTPGACGSTTVGTTAVCVNRPPATGTFAGNSNYVEVILTEATSTVFGGFASLTNLASTARAVAGSQLPGN